jgi:hypothetical protein
MDISQRRRTARLLVLVQLVVACVSVVETLVVMAFGLGSPVVLVLTVAQAVALGLAAGALGRGGRVRIVVAAQVVFLVTGGADLLVTALIGMPPALLPVVVRVALPLAVLVLLRRPRGRRAEPAGQVVTTPPRTVPA